MLPTQYKDTLKADFVIVQQPSRTYKLNFSGQPSSGMLDGTEAIKQAVFLALSTERYAHEIYSWNYGAELRDKIGRPNLPILQAEIGTAITEALMQDDRIMSVDNFKYAVKGRKSLEVSFTVQTRSGSIDVNADWGGEGMTVHFG